MIFITGFYPPLSINTLQPIAKQDADTIKFFRFLEQYIHQYKLLNTETDVSLNWKDAVAEEKNDSLNSSFDTAGYTCAACKILMLPV